MLKASKIVTWHKVAACCDFLPLIIRLQILDSLESYRIRTSTPHTAARSRSSGQRLRHYIITNTPQPVTSGAMGVSCTRYGPLERNRFVISQIARYVIGLYAGEGGCRQGKGV